MPGPPTSMPLPQSFLAMLIPVIDPQRNGTAMHLQVISYFSRGLPIQAHQNPLDAQHYSRFLILLCLASNFQQLGDGGLISVRECWAHIAHHCSFFGVCRIIYAHLYSIFRFTTDSVLNLNALLGVACSIIGAIISSCDEYNPGPRHCRLSHVCSQRPF